MNRRGFFCLVGKLVTVGLALGIPKTVFEGELIEYYFYRRAVTDKEIVRFYAQPGSDSLRTDLEVEWGE